MATLFPRRKAQMDALRRKLRRPHPPRVVSRVDLSELTPALPRLLGHAAYLQLSFFQALTGAMASAPTTSSKENLSKVAGVVLARHHGLVAELERIGEDPHSAMEPFVAPVDAFQNLILGANWYEMLVSYYVASGILDDAFRSIAEGLESDRRQRVDALLVENDEGYSILSAELRGAIDENPRLGSRLALWGRRLVGDVLLQTRSALELPANTSPQDPKLEPIFTELIAAHTRRMDDLGLTA